MMNKFFISNNLIKWEETFLYSTLSNNKSQYILGNENINEIIKPSFIILLEKYNEINYEEYYNLNNSLMYNHLICDNEMDLLTLGKEYIIIIKNSLLQIQNSIVFDNGEKLLDNTNLFDFLNFKIIGEYIEITNTNTNINTNIITTELIPNLNKLNFQYSKQIDFKILMSLILENKTIDKIISNKSIIDESLDILSQEYIICLQPKIEVLLWTISRLILCWYADTKLYNNIIKIKILINIFRSRGLKEYNKNNGILPIIQIIPKYGKKNAIKIMSNLSYFFFPYKNLGLDINYPTSFKKIDNFMYYLNGSIEFKKYIKNILKI
jgi:hypothetical protein